MSARLMDDRRHVRLDGTWYYRVVRLDVVWLHGARVLRVLAKHEDNPPRIQCWLSGYFDPETGWPNGAYGTGSNECCARAMWNGPCSHQAKEH